MKENILSILLICFVYNISVTSTSSCTNHFTCGNCAVYKDCYWCPSTNKCEDYYGEKFANLICPSKWIQHDSLCPENAARNNNGANSALFNLLNGNTNQAPLQSLLTSNSASSTSQSGGSGASSQELKDLLHKLLLLKLLRKIKAEGTSSLTAEESKMLSQLSSYRQQQQQQQQQVVATTTTTTTTKMPDMTNEIKQLLNLLGKSKHEGVVTTSKPAAASVTEKMVVPNTTSSNKANNIKNKASTTSPPQTVINNPKPQQMTSNETVMSLLKKIDEQNAGVEYQEHQPVESLGNPHGNGKVTVKPTTNKKLPTAVLTPSPSASSNSGGSSYSGTNYCKLYEEVDLCNADHNCTWCNTQDVCIRRSDTDYQGCVAAKDNLKDKEFGKIFYLNHVV